MGLVSDSEMIIMFVMIISVPYIFLAVSVAGTVPTIESVEPVTSNLTGTLLILLTHSVCSLFSTCAVHVC